MRCIYISVENQVCLHINFIILGPASVCTTSVHENCTVIRNDDINLGHIDCETNALH